MASGETRAAADRPDAGLGAGELALALRVLAAAERLPIEHPDAVAIQRATASLYKTVKRRRRSERRGAIRANDEAVTASHGDRGGRADRRRDPGPAAAPRAAGGSAGTLLRARACYVCKQRYVEVDAFYHQLCPACAARHHAHRDARTDLHGRRALLTGGRAKIGMYIALRAAARRGSHDDHDALPAGRGAALRGDGRQRAAGSTDCGSSASTCATRPRSTALAATVAARGPLDILINNAAQTVRRSPGAYSALAQAESAPLPGDRLPEIAWLGPSRRGPPGDRCDDGTGSGMVGEPRTRSTALALTAGSASPARIAANTAIDAGGLVPDLDGVQQLGPAESTRSTRSSCSRSSCAT